jgi:hypothetical protein
MEHEGAENRREISGRRALNEGRVATYRRLMDAEALLEEVRLRRGVSDTAFAEALEAVEGGRAPDDSDADLYLATLTRFVAQLGGRLEVQAVFPEDTVIVFSDPEERM